MNCYHCLLYVSGYLVAFAYEDISYKKVATQSHTTLGKETDASYAVDRNTETCMKTLPIGISTPEKTVWWKVDLGGVYSIHSTNLLFKNYNGYEQRQRGRFAGFSLYVSNSGGIQGSTLCYKDGGQLPFLNFTTTCAEYGRYVIFYNERLAGVSYPTGYILDNSFTELCEVSVYGCNNASFYGSNCDIPCPTNCKDNKCHIQNGACFNCNPGWTDIYCDKKCKDGWYGLNCTQQCEGHCKDGVTCNHVTGQCDTGCEAGWAGYICENECEDGTYGYNCINNCSGHCINNFPCNKQTGHCDNGCNPGYTKSGCRRECLTGYFGLHCEERCSGQCANSEPCDHVSGVCPSGCLDGYMGSNCTSTCEEGHFGTNCSRVCPTNCRPGTCRHTDGSCSCTTGWTGHTCSTSKTQNKPWKEDNSSCITLIIGLSIAIFMNLILIGLGVILCRKIHSNKVNVPSSQLSCGRNSVYQDTFMKTEETPSYQELNLPQSDYQNTTLQ